MRGAATLLLGVALASAALPCAAQELGRLFFTPEQRSALDARRKARVPDRPAAAAAVAAPTVRLDGYVKRSSGRSTVWVNSEALDESALESPHSPRGSSDDRVSVPVGESRSRIPMRPGETLDRGNGEVRDVLGGGEIQIRRAAPTK
jgi:hypothetical protein